MIRIMVIAALSMAAGAAAALLYVGESSSRHIVLGPEGTDAPGAIQTINPRSLEDIVGSRSSASLRADIYRLVTQADARSLAALLEETGTLADSSSKRLLLEAISLRLTEIDFDTALKSMQTLELESRQATALGLILFEALGPSASSLERVSALVPQMDERRFRIDALGGLIRSAFPDSIPDASLLALFDSHENMERALTQAIYNVGRDNPDAARRMLDEHITDPELHDRVSNWLDTPRERRIVVRNGGIIFSN